MIKTFTPKISAKNNLTGRIMIHLLLTILGFIGSFIIIFWSSARKVKTLDILIANPFGYIVLCLICCFVINAIYYRKHFKDINIRSVKFISENDMICILIQKYYSNIMTEKCVQRRNVKIETKEKDIFLSNNKATEYQFIVDGTIIGVIDTSDICWEKENKTIKEIIKTIENYSI
jgi:hypothetical protein